MSNRFSDVKSVVQIRGQTRIQSFELKDTSEKFVYKVFKAKEFQVICMLNQERSRSFYFDSETAISVCLLGDQGESHPWLFRSKIRLLKIKTFRHC